MQRLQSTPQIPSLHYSNTPTYWFRLCLARTHTSDMDHLLSSKFGPLDTLSWYVFASDAASPVPLFEVKSG